MRKFIVALISQHDFELEQYRIEAESKYEAVKEAILHFTDEEHRDLTEEFMESADYPKTIEELYDLYNSMKVQISIIEISSF